MLIDENIKIRMLSIWGDVFEIAVKRGIIAYLIENNLMNDNDPSILIWKSVRTKDVLNHCIEQAEITNDLAIEYLKSYFNHLMNNGYGIGYTAIREYYKKSSKKIPMSIETFWCPFELKDRRKIEFSSLEVIAKQFKETFQLHNASETDLISRGWPANADLMLIMSNRKERKILCFEFSLNVSTQLNEYSEAQAHRFEIEKFNSLIQERGVFSNISAEINDPNGALTISKDIVSHLRAFTSKDKPLYKLMQGCSYITKFASLLNKPDKKTHLDVLAITAAGIESITAPYLFDDTKMKLMKSLGDIYVDTKNYIEKDYDEAISSVYAQIKRGLPRTIKKQFENFFSENGEQKEEIYIKEEILDFKNPNSIIAPQEIETWLDECDKDENAKSFLNQSPKKAIKNELPENAKLRDLNAATITTAFKSMKQGTMKILGLLGHPGIGKTTSVVKMFSNDEIQDNILFCYFSPRIVINGDVTSKIIEECKEGSFAVTTNSNLIAIAPDWARQNDIKKEVKGAVSVEFEKPIILKNKDNGGILHLNREESNTVVEGNYYKKAKKIDVDTRNVEIERSKTPQVLKTLSSETGWLMKENPEAPVVAMTAATQGFRLTRNNKTTIESLSSLFTIKDANTPAGKKERSEFAKKRPFIVVMIDEITGDGAGAPMVHEISGWLNDQFIKPFDGEESPFKVILILADASLSTPETLNSYLQSAADLNENTNAPPRIMITPASREIPFGVEATRIKLNGRNEDVLYVMADAYPATKLEIEYRIRLDEINTDKSKNTENKTLERQQHGERVLKNSAEAILNALDDKKGFQVIYFAQDKAFLEALKINLEKNSNYKIETLHSSIDANKRRLLVSDENRDKADVLLMTSAGSRGVSFPKATTIIIMMPRFEIESSLMEIGQMIFRGRGNYKENGEILSGDNLERKIVFLIEDYIKSNDPDISKTKISRKIELASLLVLLRASIETRIKGYSKSPGFKGSIIPVGRIGIDETADTMSASIQNFLKEIRVTAINENKELSGALKKIESLIVNIFENFSIDGRIEGKKSFTSSNVMEEYSLNVCNLTSKLVKNKNDNAKIDDTVFFVGPCIYESWADVKNITEYYEYSLKNKDYKDQLYNLSYVISQDKHPKKIKDAAIEVCNMLKRHDEALENLEYNIKKKFNTPNMWIALPSDWSRFLTDKPSNIDERRNTIDAQDLWLGAMRASLSLFCTPTFTMPIIPNYRDKPFASCLSLGDPTGMNIAFDNRYFMHTHEFNLLNVLLHSYRD